MKALVRVNDKITVELEAAKQKDLFKAIASAHEVFGEHQCALCGSKLIVPVWRTTTVQKGKKVETFEFPEWRCLGVKDGKRCGAKLSLGTINDDTGTLFPQRKLTDKGRPPTKEEKEAGETGKYGAHRGWHRWVPKDEEGGGM